ncbi:MAG TPA: TetR/AcrR family transcriptional regulator [Spirochaetota bacterium]|nr:TetR/AcrR family transcriptional regulator [Spirochaetota bacterium]HQO02397.1 TetR/AcrR family transcriptional regulator [Spirochaetota bacterium]
MATRNSEKLDKRKLQIGTAAYEVIALKGYNNFTIDDIANHAGLSKGGVLHYFKSKEEILIYLLEQISMIIEKNIKRRAEKYRTPERKMKALIISYAATAKRNPAFYTVMVDFWAQVPVNPRIKSINTMIHDRMVNEIKKIIDLGREQGEFRDIESVNAAFAIHSMILNSAVQWTLNDSVYNIDHVARSIMKIVMEYVKK